MGLRDQILDAMPAAQQGTADCLLPHRDAATGDGEGPYRDHNGDEAGASSRDEATSDSRDEPEDEVAAAMHRQLDVLVATLGSVGSLLAVLALQADNLRAELVLLSRPLEPVDEEPFPQVLPPVAGVQRTLSGALVAASVPDRPETWCDHDDVLIVDTATGPVRVCPECDGDG